MDADQIPAELVEAADLALAGSCVEVEVTTGVTKCVCPTDEQIRTILAAVLPEVQARAWDEGYAKGNLDGYFGTKDEANPYRTPTEETTRG